MADTKLFKAKNNEGGTFGATLSAGGNSATLSVAVGNAPGVIVAEIGTAKEEHIYYAFKDDGTKIISGLIRDYTNLNGGVGQEHLSGQPWETSQAAEYVNNIIDSLREGYISEYNSPSYVSASSFTVTGDLTASYTAGRPLRYNNDNTKLGIVASSSYSGITGLTTVLTGFGTVPSTLTSVEYGIQPKGAAIATAVGVQNGSYQYAADSGSASAYVVALSPAPTAYTAGMTILFKASNTNTAAPTINVNALGAKNLYLGSQAVPNGYIQSGNMVLASYDGTQFQVLSVTRVDGWVDLTDGATINIDLSLGNKFRVRDMGGNRTLTVSNAVVGKTFEVQIWQDSTGSRLVSVWPTGTSTFATTDVNTSTDIITVGRDIPSGTPIKFTSTTAVPAGLVSGTKYYAVRQSATTIKVASSLANAQAGTTIDITDAGTGTHTIACLIRWSNDTEPILATGKYLMDSFVIQCILTGVFIGGVAIAAH